MAKFIDVPEKKHSFSVETVSGKASAYIIEAGRKHPLGAVPDENGVNFSVFSVNATGIELLLFNQHDDPEPIEVIRLDPQINKTFHFWHVYLRNLKPGMHYAYRVEGPDSEEHRFYPRKVLIDPYAKGNTCSLWKRADACCDADNLETSMRSVVIDISGYDWEGDKPLNIPMNESIIYEMHVGGFTKSPTSGVKYPGTFSGIIEKIPYLKQIGITAIELLPVMQFDPSSISVKNPEGEPLKNYWGYSTISFFAPHPDYCVRPEEGQHINEFRDMVKALHKEGIEVILDVVLNHTDEGNHEGPVINFKGFDNSIYYHLVETNKKFYRDYTGCGNTVNCNHPIVEKFILECLEFWIKEMHVDGFRFDEASILSRDIDGKPMLYPPLLWDIEISEVLTDTKIIAEVFETGGLYQIGYFPGYRWAEWNREYRDDIRKFVKGDPGILGHVASRISGSADLYKSSGHLPVNSLNFISCHDGFTLNDIVSYNQRHNWENGEYNNDGISDNQSWNCGFEGETDNLEINYLRKKQIKNFFSILFLSRGVPMILAGDEICRTQKGNNNAYCQDNEINWFNWDLIKYNDDILRFFSLITRFRFEHPTLFGQNFFDGSVNERGLSDIEWHGVELSEPDWDNPEGRAFSFTLGGSGDDADIHVMMNMYWKPLGFKIPAVQGRKWYRVIDTSLSSPYDFLEGGKEELVSVNIYPVKDRSITVLISK